LPRYFILKRLKCQSGIDFKALFYSDTCPPF
jgi:hypothetical protein